MKKSIFILLLNFIIFVSQLNAQTPNTQIGYADQVAQTVVFLSSEYPFSDKSGGGSAIIIISDAAELYIVTATHVLKGFDANSYVILQDTIGRAVPTKISDIAAHGD